MDWHTLPGFDEKFSRITTKEHKTFGGNVVEVLYGAVDENGNPVQPKELASMDAEDGSELSQMVNTPCSLGNIQHVMVAHLNLAQN